MIRTHINYWLQDFSLPHQRYKPNAINIKGQQALWGGRRVTKNTKHPKPNNNGKWLKKVVIGVIRIIGDSSDGA